MKNKKSKQPLKMELNYPKDRYRGFAKLQNVPAPALPQFQDTLEKEDLLTL